MISSLMTRVRNLIAGGLSASAQARSFKYEVDFKRLLIYRFVLINSVFFAIVGALFYTGYLLPVYTTDSSYLTFAITALFGLGWLWSANAVYTLSKALDRSKVAGFPRLFKEDRDKAMAKTSWLYSISEWLVGLGLLGTVVGFSMALGAVDEGSLMNATGTQSSVATLMSGMRVALNTTLLGASFAMWNQVNLQLHRTAFISYWSDVLKRS